MNTTRGIFDDFPNQTDPKDSPFAIAGEAADKSASPFGAVNSPFTIADEKKDDAKAQAAAGPLKKDSPFQMAEPSEGFGFEAPARLAEAAPVTSPFEAVPASTPPPFAAAAETSKLVSPSTQAALAAFGGWHESATPAPVEKAAAPAPVDFGDSDSDSYAIRQLELRAIFGVDREMTTDEILQRSRALTGIRNLARVSPQDAVAIDAIRSLVPKLGFGSGALKLSIGSEAVEFIREGKELLAVQTDGGFAPGVRETLMLVARELGRSA